MAKYCCVCGGKIGMMQGTPMFNGVICLSCSAKIGNLTPLSDPQERQRALEFFESVLSSDAITSEVRDGLNNALKSYRDKISITNGITLPCSGGFILRTDGENIIISRKKTEEVIPISVIQSVSLTKPGLIYGTIEFTTSKAASAGVNIGFGVIVAAGVQNSFDYYKEDYEDAKQFRDVIMNYKKSTSHSDIVPIGTVVSVVEEIRGLKTLLDDGILTQDEFDAKKKQLLGL